MITRQSAYTSSASLNDLVGFRDLLFLLIGTKQRLPIAQYPEERNASATANDRTGTLTKLNPEKFGLATSECNDYIMDSWRRRLTS